MLTKIRFRYICNKCGRWVGGNSDGKIYLRPMEKKGHSCFSDLTSSGRITGIPVIS